MHPATAVRHEEDRQRNGRVLRLLHRPPRRHQEHFGFRVHHLRDPRRRLRQHGRKHELERND